jgi:AcrR family transcriptional regulator
MQKKNLSRQERAQITKEKLFCTAVELIRQNGYADVSVNEICRSAGVAKGTFYVHYASKEDIIRESYYSDMTDFMMEKFHAYESAAPTASIMDKIRKFLWLEFSFTEYIGYEVTCLAYAMNLSACVPGPCVHLQKRRFTDILRNLLEEGSRQQIFVDDATTEERFLFLETSVRGMMASWCFSNASFSIETVGQQYADRILQSFLK